MNRGKLVPIVVCLLGALVVGGCARTTYRVTSEPPGAMIYVNRHPYGVTPRTVSYRNQRRRDAVFIVRRQGYEEQERTLSAQGGSAHFVLEPVDGPARKPEQSVPAPPQVTGDIMVNTGQEGTELYVDGSFVGNAPADLKLDEGIHVIEVRKPGYVPYRREVRVFAGSKTVLEVALEAQSEVAQQEMPTAVAESAESTEEQEPTAIVPPIPPPATKPAARQVKLVCVQGNNPIAAKEIWLSYYDEDAQAWATENGTTDEEGSVLFEVPQGKSGGSSTFTFASSETEVRTRADEIERSERLGFRIPPDPTQMSVTVGTDSKLNATVIDGVLVPSRSDGRETIESDASLLKAARNGDAFIVKALLAAGADADTRDRRAQTPLMAAASKSHMEVLEALLAAGADVNAQRVDGQTALISAAFDGRAEVVHVLLSHDADPNLSTERGTTALIGAAYKGNIEIVQALLAVGADVDAREKDGQTALMGAAYKEHPEIVRILLASGADASIAKNDGSTALTAALDAGDEEIVELIKAAATQAATAKAAENGTPEAEEATDAVLATIEPEDSRKEAQPAGTIAKKIEPATELEQSEERNAVPSPQESAEKSEPKSPVELIGVIRLRMIKISEVRITTYQYDGAFRTGSTTTFKFDYHPDAHTQESLRQAGFNIIPEDSNEIEDATLLVHYAEKKRGGGLDSPTAFYFSFILSHKAKGKLLEGSGTPNGFDSVEELENHPQFRDIGALVRKAFVQEILGHKETPQQAVPTDPQSAKTTGRIQFKNTFGELALVKCIGPTGRAYFIKPENSFTFTVTAGRYDFMIRLGKGGAYRYLKSIPLPVQPSAQGGTTLSSSDEWRDIEETDFVKAKPQVVVVTGRLIDQLGKSVPWASVRLSPYKNGKASLCFSEEGVLLNPNGKIDGEGRFHLALNLNSFPDHDEFILEARFSSFASSDVPMKNAQGHLIVLEFSDTSEYEVDLGDIRQQ